MPVPPFHLERMLVSSRIEYVSPKHRGGPGHASSRHASASCFSSTPR